jgi:glycosyltransferase involved in cell wall biosynthesis
MIGIENKELDFCLLIPCYNNLEGLILSINSVEYHSDHFIIVVVDDGSEVPVTVKTIKEKITNNYTLIVLRNEMNKGITNALNKGLKWIEENTASKYVARLDCGDLCKNNRFFRQVDYMDKHPETGLLGSWCVFETKTKSNRYYYKTPIDHKNIIRAMHLKNVFIHPSVMFKTDLLSRVGYYPEGFKYVEDYAFFWQLIKIEPSHILNEFLITCEINEEGISFKNRRKQLVNRLRIIAKYGTNPFLKLVGMLRIHALRFFPQRLVLPLKNAIKKQ